MFEKGGVIHELRTAEDARMKLLGCLKVMTSFTEVGEIDYFSVKQNRTSTCAEMSEHSSHLQSECFSFSCVSTSTVIEMK